MIQTRSDKSQKHVHPVMNDSYMDANFTRVDLDTSDLSITNLESSAVHLSSVDRVFDDEQIAVRVAYQH